MADTWFVGRDGIREGPLSEAQVRRMVEGGELASADLVWREGMPDWVPAASVPELFAAQTVAANERNPYAAPDSDSTLVADQFVTSRGVAEYAEYLPRVAAFLLDGLILFLAQCVTGFGIGVVSIVLAGNDPDAEGVAAVLAQLVSWLVGMGMSLWYSVALETSAKQGTWGKQIVGIKVTNLEGERISAGQAVGRWLAKFITACTMGIGYLMPLFTDRKQTLHDMMAGCLALKS